MAAYHERGREPSQHRSILARCGTGNGHWKRFFFKDLPKLNCSTYIIIYSIFCELLPRRARPHVSRCDAFSVAANAGRFPRCARRRRSSRGTATSFRSVRFALGFPRSTGVTETAKFTTLLRHRTCCRLFGEANTPASTNSLLASKVKAEASVTEHAPTEFSTTRSFYSWPKRLWILLPRWLSLSICQLSPSLMRGAAWSQDCGKCWRSAGSSWMTETVVLSHFKKFCAKRCRNL
jgi:hypothetical protein